MGLVTLFTKGTQHLDIEVTFTDSGRGSEVVAVVEVSGHVVDRLQ